MRSLLRVLPLVCLALVLSTLSGGCFVSPEADAMPEKPSEQVSSTEQAVRYSLFYEYYLAENYEEAAFQLETFLEAEPWKEGFFAYPERQAHMLTHATGLYDALGQPGRAVELIDLVLPHLAPEQQREWTQRRKAYFAR